MQSRQSCRICGVSDNMTLRVYIAFTACLSQFKTRIPEKGIFVWLNKIRCLETPRNACKSKFCIITYVCTSVQRKSNIFCGLTGLIELVHLLFGRAIVVHN